MTQPCENRGEVELGNETEGRTDGGEAATGLGARPASASVAVGVAEGFAQAGRAAALAARRCAVPVAELAGCVVTQSPISPSQSREVSSLSESVSFSRFASIRTAHRLFGLIQVSLAELRRKVCSVFFSSFKKKPISKVFYLVVSFVFKSSMLIK